MDFIHPLLNEEIVSIAGYYTITKEEILPHSKGPILYLVGHAAMDCSCCGIKGCGYAMVAGRVTGLRTSMSKDDRAISQVTPVEEEFHQEVSAMIRMKEGVGQVHILLASGGKKIMY